jgi:autotransporter-associated beta strand protein
VETPGTSGPLGRSGTISFGGGTLQYNSSGVDAADYSSRFSTAAGQQYSIDVPLLASSGTPMTVNCSQPLNSSGGSLVKNGRGTFKLSAPNAYTGNTIINAGTLALSGSGSIADSPNIAIVGGATFDVSGLLSTFTLGAAQTFSDSGPVAFRNGNTATASGTLSLAYSPGTPSLIITNGTLTLSSATVLNISNVGAALGAGTYTIIGSASTGNVGTVAGTVPSTFTIGGSGIVSGTASLQIAGDVLNLVVRLPVPRVTGISVNGPVLTLTATNGSSGGQFVLMESTNLALPLSQWTPVLTNNFDGSGNLDLSTDVINPNVPAEFYILLQ